MKEFFMNNYMYFIAIAIIAFGIIWVAIKRPQQIKQWLISACAQAELLLGSGTGQLKLREVFNAFISRFPIIALVISFDKFSEWVDIALKELREMIEKNPKVAAFFAGAPKNEDAEDKKTLNE